MVGGPGAGKGTQAATLAERLGLAHVASGDLFRRHLREGTELGKQAAKYMERGSARARRPDHRDGRAAPE